MVSSKRFDHISYTIDNYYDSYKEYTLGNTAFKVSRRKFKEVLNDYFKFIADELIVNSKEFRLPARMGWLSVIKVKPKKYDSTTLRVDFNETRLNEKTVLHLNEHSGGYNFRFFWWKRDMIVENKSMYQLVMSRANKRRLAYMIKTEHKDYIEK